jgi:hypothetical protein
VRKYLTLGVIGVALIAGKPFQRTVVAWLAHLFPSRRIAILTRWYGCINTWWWNPRQQFPDA